MKRQIKTWVSKSKDLESVVTNRRIILQSHMARFLCLNYVNKQVLRDKGALFFPGKGGEIKIESTAKVTLHDNFMFHCFDTNRCTTSTYLLMNENSELKVNGRFKVFYGSDIAVFKDAKLELGSGYCNAGTQIRCSKSITIGHRVAIARDVYIMDSDTHQLLDDQHEPDQPVHIGDDVWIGARAMILKGVTIGNGAIIAAGAVVNKDVPAHSVAAGVPARVVRENVRFKL